MLRRSLVSGALGVFALVLTRSAFAGSYLDRAALLLEGSRKDQTELRAKIMDKELAKVVRTVAEARLAAASNMDVPSQVAKAHPHLLLALTKVERAAQAAVDGNIRTVVELLDAATREEGVFKSALKDLGFPLTRAAAGPAP